MTNSIIVNKSAFFKAVNIVASKMEGHRSARISLAYSIVFECRLTDVNTLFDRETMTNLIKMVVSAGITPEAVKEAKSNKPKKVRKQSSKTNQKRVKKADKAEKIIYNGLPSNLEEYFTPEQCDTVNNLIVRYVENANKNIGDYMDAQRFNFMDGMQALSNVETLEDLQATMVAYFMRDYAKRMIIKMLDMGIGYKKLNTVKSLENIEQKQSYMNASSNRGNITAFEVEDILNDLIVDAYRLLFNDEMFDSVGLAMTTLYFRVSNVIQVRTRELRNQTKVITAKKQYVQEEGASVSTEEEALQMAEHLNIFTDAEMNIIRMRIAGFKKQEIDKVVGKRTDRDFNKMKKAYAQAI